jgi:hypothetical protein
MRPFNRPPEPTLASRDDPSDAASADTEPDLRSAVADVRDGLTREERVVLWVLHETQKERGGRSVPTTMLWGRVCEHFYISPEDLSAMLARLGAQALIRGEAHSPIRYTKTV